MKGKAIRLRNHCETIYDIVNSYGDYLSQQDVNTARRCADLAGDLVEAIEYEHEGQRRLQGESIAARLHNVIDEIAYDIADDPALHIPPKDVGEFDTAVDQAEELVNDVWRSLGGGIKARCASCGRYR